MSGECDNCGYHCLDCGCNCINRDMQANRLLELLLELEDIAFQFSDDNCLDYEYLVGLLDACATLFAINCEMSLSEFLDHQKNSLEWFIKYLKYKEEITT